MAKKSMIAKARRPQKYAVRSHNRCLRCGRPRGWPASLRPVPHLSARVTIVTILVRVELVGGPQATHRRYADRANANKALHAVVEMPAARESGGVPARGYISDTRDQRRTIGW
jgi:hypothetical protein